MEGEMNGLHKTGFVSARILDMGATGSYPNRLDNNAGNGRQRWERKGIGYRTSSPLPKVSQGNEGGTKDFPESRPRQRTKGNGRTTNHGNRGRLASCHPSILPRGRNERSNQGLLARQETQATPIARSRRTAVLTSSHPNYIIPSPIPYVSECLGMSRTCLRTL